MQIKLLATVTIPSEIINLTRSKPPEKLLLALLASTPDGKYTRACWALGISKAGYRKLRQRLIKKEFLTDVNGHVHIHIPGYAFKHSPVGGSFVRILSVPKKGEKVSTQLPISTPSTGHQPLMIPSELLSCKHLSASAKLLLAVYAADPGAPNNQVQEVIGISRSGLKKLKGSLLAKRVLIETEQGYKVRLPGFVHMQGHFVTELQALNSGHKVSSPTPKLTPARMIASKLKKSLSIMRRKRDTTPNCLLCSVSRAIQEVENQSPEGPDRDAVLAKLRRLEDFYFVWNHIFENVPRIHEQDFMKMFATATPKQLATIREKAEAKKLAGIPPTKLLGCFGDGKQVDAEIAIVAAA